MSSGCGRGCDSASLKSALDVPWETGWWTSGDGTKGRVGTNSMTASALIAREQPGT